MTSVINPDHIIRPVILGDAEAVLALYHAISLKIVGEIEETMDDLLTEWQDTDLERNTRMVIKPDGRLIGYAIVDVDTTPELMYFDAYLHPDEWEHDSTTEPYLLNWIIERARENIAVVPSDVRVVLRGYTHSKDAHYKHQLEAAGLALIRHSFRMRIDLAETPVRAELPDGFTLRIADPDDDWRPVLECIRDAWRDHYGYVERPFEAHYKTWRAFWEPYRERRVWLLAMDGDVIAGVCLCETHQNDDPSFGWVSTLAVRRAYRRRGLGEALLKNGFSELYDRGIRRVGLGVDASSLTGAVALYERAGMRVETRYDLYEMELRSGRDTSIQEAG
jgi:ribosomal protein S18 acetylase RimI-like enzyme